MGIQSINPVNGQVVKVYTEDSHAAVTEKIEKGQRAWLKWRQTSISERGTILRKASQLLRSRSEELASLMAVEIGKPTRDGRAEVEKCALACDYYAENGEDFLKDIKVDTDASNSYVSFQPVGIVLAVMPWNFPFWQVFRFLAPALVAGNCGLLKHASNVPGCALEIERILRDAGCPEGVFQTLMVGSKAVPNIIEHPYVKAVTLTGSTEAGKQVARDAGSQLKKTVLELGGSDPYVILDDADLNQAAEICAQSRLVNNGQSCVAAKRFIVVETVQEKFTELFIEKMSSRTIGDPFDPKTDLGPMARIDLRDELHKQVLDNVKAGAKLILGGELPENSGNNAFYAPTILSGIKKGMPAYEEEIFGPVASIISAKNTQEAIDIANDTSFGLGAAVFTKDLASGEEIARNQLQAGCCFVNTFVKSDPRLPFGGINQSGYGRELSVFGIREFVNIKTVFVK